MSLHRWVCLLIVGLAVSSQAQAEPAACLSSDLNSWPAPSKPYFMIIADTSASMATATASASSCGFGTSREAHLRCSLRTILQAFSGKANFGLATFPRRQSNCGATCFGTCQYSDYPNNVGMSGCGPGSGTTRRGAFIQVPMLQDAFWTTPPPAPNLPTLLGWLDNNCVDNRELFAQGNAPLSGALRDMKRYLSSSWTAPDNSVTYTSPLASQDLAGTGINGSTACRSVNVILIIDGGESCDSVGSANAVAADLYQNGVTVAGKVYKVRTHVVSFGTGGNTEADEIAAAGGTVTSRYGSSDVELSSALISVIESTLSPEVCDNADNNCNGCTDEGFRHHCNLGQTCCTWANAAQRTTCLANYEASITPSAPLGNRTLLPCTTAAQQALPTSWLCYDPGESCDNVDNNCQGGVDEGVTKCGSPLHCPGIEACNGLDDNCNGQTDEGAGCNGCVPSAEVCDGCDNDCDGIADNGVSPQACGQAIPPNCAGTLTCKPAQPVGAIGGCIPTGGWNVCSHSPQTELCDGQDNDCDGQVDEDVPAVDCVPPGAPQGLSYGPQSQCKKGKLACGTSTCIGWVGPSTEVCDGVDNDCDGVVDVGSYGVGQTCGLDRAPCAAGTTTCVAGVLVCQGGQAPVAESCDGVDNDCDGQTDEAPLTDGPAPGMTGCWALPGTCCSFGPVQWCPPPGATCSATGTLSAPCQAGTLTCVGAGGWACRASVVPGPERCDGVDEDCNGVTDDGVAAVGTPCSQDRGACVAGTLQCSQGTLSCSGVLPGTESCNGADDDCDGQTDEDLPVTAVCSASYDTTAFPGARDQGECHAGWSQCAAGQATCRGAVGPVAEVCDGRDNDCDGQTDEAGATPDGIDGSTSPIGAVGGPCLPAGACTAGVVTCVEGGAVCIGAALPKTEVCNGLDDDCDGETDAPKAGGPAVCSRGNVCVTFGSGTLCALPCGTGAHPCPTGQTCQPGTTGSGAGSFCAPTPVAGTPPIDLARGLRRSERNLPVGCASVGGFDLGALLLALAALPLALKRRRKGLRPSPLASVGLAALLALSGCNCSESPPVSAPDTGGAATEDAGTTSQGDAGSLADGAVSEDDAGAQPGDSGQSDDAGEVPHDDGGTLEADAGAGADAGCQASAEVCDGLDNDCNGQTDDVDFASPEHCGTCGTSCFDLLLNVMPATVTCSPGQAPGTAPGICSGTCAPDYHDRDGDGSCETYCVQQGSSDATCDGRDDDCDGSIDEDVDLCSLAHCGRCGRACAPPHATVGCTPMGPLCELGMAECAVVSCDCVGAGNCWWNVDGLAGNGCEYACDRTNGGVEVCDGLDNDCNGKVDDALSDPVVGVACHGSALGVCAAPEHAGLTACRNGQVVCAGPEVLYAGSRAESCNGVDDDCDGEVDEAVPEVGQACGSNATAPCRKGRMECQSGSLTCIGAIEPVPEVCNGRDDDCDGAIDLAGTLPPSDAVGACSVPPPPPANTTSPCRAGALACVGGVVTCQNAVGPAATVDSCGVDANCDGRLTHQPDRDTDVSNCGSCGNVCGTGKPHSLWACLSGACLFQGCQPGYYDLDGDQGCEYACSFASATEACNGVDDDCNGQVDEGVIAPSPKTACGVSPAATTPECTVQVAVACVSGAWKCTFPAGVCGPSCAAAPEQCDGLDNDCNGLVDEDWPTLHLGCASDDGAPVPGHGPCRTTGTVVCTSATSAGCSAVKADCATLPGGCTELCDGVDNDCDGMVDESFKNPGYHPAYVRPAVTKIGMNLWVYSYEASRPTATNLTPGAGNGYWLSAPPGSTLDKTTACSVEGRIPWYSVSPEEAQQVCRQMGGFLCSRAQYQTACRPVPACQWGYYPRGLAGSACATDQTATKFCNLASAFDFASGVPGDQDGLLPTASPRLQNCWADWSFLAGNTGDTDQVFDLTGNLREITQESTSVFALMGGAFLGDSASASCDFTLYQVASTFRSFDAGFRCCFFENPN